MSMSYDERTYAFAVRVVFSIFASCVYHACFSCGVRCTNGQWSCDVADEYRYAV